MRRAVTWRSEETLMARSEVKKGYVFGIVYDKKSCETKFFFVILQ